MMITDRIATALAAVLTAANLPHSPAVQTGVSDLENEEESIRVISNGITSERYKTFPGIFDVAGEVVVMIDMTLDSPKEKMDEITESIRQVIGSKRTILDKLRAQDPRLTCVLFNHIGDEDFNNGRRLGSRFSWTARASHDPHNPN